MKTLIIGGTGKTGRHLISQALVDDHIVTALVRNPAKLKIEHPNLRILQGDILQYKDVAAAVIGQDAVLSALGHKRFFIPTNILTKGTANLISAMEEYKVNRLICITSLGVNDSKFRLGLYYTLFVIPVILFFYFMDKSKQEKLIMNSTLDWTIVRPAQMTNGKKRENYLHGPNLGSYILTKLISRTDVAHFMIRQLTDTHYIFKTPGLHY
ncbi:SDR family oxidoreductase [Flavobacteriaceae bacterium KMM 6897]|nr:SDR family oxidoreductase [Flavobacteriaceae bacterium KMM 6897]MEB8344435.1 SDR family oxidoreductase [Flavobacteriaceae bacterium KMM 6898]